MTAFVFVTPTRKHNKIIDLVHFPSVTISTSHMAGDRMICDASIPQSRCIQTVPIGARKRRAMTHVMDGLAVDETHNICNLVNL